MFVFFCFNSEIVTKFNLSIEGRSINTKHGHAILDPSVDAKELHDALTDLFAIKVIFSKKKFTTGNT